MVEHCDFVMKNGPTAERGQVKDARRSRGVAVGLRNRPTSPGARAMVPSAFLVAVTYPKIRAPGCATPTNDAKMSQR
jgi:hypothetical protein